MNKLEERFEDIIHDQSGNTCFDSHESYENCAKYAAKEAKDIAIEFLNWVMKNCLMELNLKTNEVTGFSLKVNESHRTREELFDEFINQRYE